MIVNPKKIDFSKRVDEIYTELNKKIELDNKKKTDFIKSEQCKYYNNLLYKSKMTIGNIVVMNTEHFNWLQKRIWKILLGIKIEDVEEEKR